MEAPTVELTRENFNSIFFQTFIKTKVQPEIPILRCAVPLPKAQKFKAKLITGAIFIIACLLVWKTQSGAGAIAAVIITYLSYYLIQMFIANKRYFIRESPLCEIKINHNEIYCAVAGGLLMGLGMLILFRHRSSLGGFNVFYWVKHAIWVEFFT